MWDAGVGWTVQSLRGRHQRRITRSLPVRARATSASALRNFLRSHIALLSLSLSLSLSLCLSLILCVRTGTARVVETWHNRSTWSLLHHYSSPKLCWGVSVAGFRSARSSILCEPAESILRSLSYCCKLELDQTWNDLSNPLKKRPVMLEN